MSKTDLIDVSEKKLLDEREAAKLLGISRGTLLRLRADGALSFYRIGGQIRYSLEKHIAPFLAKVEHSGGCADQLAADDGHASAA